MSRRFAWTVLAVLLVLPVPAMAQPLVTGPQLPPRAAPTAHVETQQLPALDTTPHFDADAATAKYLARLTAAERRQSDAYVTGNHWLRLAELIYWLGVAAVLLWLPVFPRICDWAGRHARGPISQSAICAGAYIVIVTVLEFPLSLYQGFLRRHAYGLLNQDFAGWFSGFAARFAVALVGGAIALVILYVVIRAARKTWWLWCTGLCVLFLAGAGAVYPAAIAPLFHHATPLPPGPLKQDILSLARANAIPAHEVWVDDATRRTGARVSGLFGDARITLNDTLLRDSTHDEILVATGRAMGRYAMGSATRQLLLFGLVILAGFAFVAFGFRLAVRLFGPPWPVREPSDMRGLPALGALAGIFLFLATPATSTIARTAARQADIFGLNAVRKPDAFATAVLKQAAYRPIAPAGWEEILFSHTPSVSARIHTAMVWKKAHIGDRDIRDTANIP